MKEQIIDFLTELLFKNFNIEIFNIDNSVKEYFYYDIDCFLSLKDQNLIYLSIFNKTEIIICTKNNNIYEIFDDIKLRNM
jgi:hypothetical protein